MHMDSLNELDTAHEIDFASPEFSSDNYAALKRNVEQNSNGYPIYASLTEYCIKECDRGVTEKWKNQLGECGYRKP